MRSAACTIAIAALVFAGCGSGHDESKPLSKRDYVRKVNATQEEVFAKVNPATIMASAQGGDRARGIQAVQEATESEADDLEQLAPPREIAAAHRRFVSALRRYARDLGSIVDKIHDGTLPPARLSATLKSLDSVKAVQAARATIIKRGYKIR